MREEIDGDSRRSCSEMSMTTSQPTAARTRTTQTIPISVPTKKAPHAPSEKDRE
jgi:hypothetical protein